MCVTDTQDLKRSIIDKCVIQLVPLIIIPFAESVMASGLRSVDRNSLAVFSNTCGVLRYDHLHFCAVLVFFVGGLLITVHCLVLTACIF